MPRRALADWPDAFTGLVAAELATVPFVDVDRRISVRVRTNHEAAGVALETVDPYVAKLLTAARDQAAADERGRWADEFARLAASSRAQQQPHDAAPSGNQFRGERAAAYADVVRRLRHNLTEAPPGSGSGLAGPR